MMSFIVLAETKNRRIARLVRLETFETTLASLDAKTGLLTGLLGGKQG